MHMEVVILGRSVVVKKDEKVRSIFNEFGLEITLNDFKRIFKERYPKEWKNINDTFNRHEAKQKPGKKRHPMPHPEKYLENAFKVYKKKLEQEKFKQDNSSTDGRN